MANNGIIVGGVIATAAIIFAVFVSFSSITDNGTGELIVTNGNHVETVGETIGVGKSYDYSLIDIFEKSEESVVQVNVLRGASDGGMGSGFVYSEDGYVITNQHVVKDAQKVTVTFLDGESYIGDVIGTDQDLDIAVVKVSPSNTYLQPIKIGDSSKLKVGEKIKVTYGQDIVSTNFSLDDSLDSTSSETISEILELSTDKNSYIPGETVLFSADVTTSIEYGGLDYIVSNPNGKVIFEGTIFPNDKFSIIHKAGGGQIFPFSTQLFMSTVNPVYGEYQIEGIFKSQNNRGTSENTLQSSMAFSLVEDIKEDVTISLSTDKSVYSVGDIIKITGRSNDYWTETVNLDVIQTGVLTQNADNIKGQYIRPDPFTLNESIRLNGDGTFKFEFKLVESFNTTDDYTDSYGDYKISVSEYFGGATVFFTVVENPETFVDVRTPLGFTSDKPEYVLGTAISLSGKIADWEPIGNQSLQYVEVTFLDPSGKPIMSDDSRAFDVVTRSSYDYEQRSPNDKLRITANPDPVGIYSMDVILFPIQFDYGTYTAIASHPSTKLTESIQFEIKSAQNDTILQGTETEEPITMKLCKSDRAHANEIIKDLQSIGKGEIAPSMESVDCSDDLNFHVGDKLVVTGTVIPKDNTSLTQSSTGTSGQTQEGHSYTTNYNQAAMNYVLVSIPYPQSLSIASAFQTVPDADENYTGGGGSGEGGAYYEDEDGNIIRGDVEGRDSSGSTGYDGTVIMKKQKLLLTDMNFKAYPDENGNFAGVFELRAGVFKDGTYLVKADYFGYHIEQVVPIIDKSLKGGLKPNIVINLENEEFTPGDAVRINGLIENIYYYDSVSVKIETPDVSKINCLQGHQCGFGNTAKNLRIAEDVTGSVFFWNYKIPDTSAAVGKYTIVVDTHFGEYKKDFFVVDESEIIGDVSPPTPDSSVKVPKKMIEKFNRISDTEIPIILGEKSSEDSTLLPRVLQGSLFTSARGEESNVNLRITASNGQCVIGQDSNCLVTESTRKPGAIYSIVSIDDINYKIRYSGNDVRLEKFSIVPEESGSQINIDNWNVEIIKDEQPSRFYYKVSYIALE